MHCIYKWLVVSKAIFNTNLHIFTSKPTYIHLYERFAGLNEYTQQWQKTQHFSRFVDKVDTKFSSYTFLVSLVTSNNKLTEIN